MEKAREQEAADGLQELSSLLANRQQENGNVSSAIIRGRILPAFGRSLEGYQSL